MSHNRFISPSSGLLGRLANWLANNRAIRTLRRRVVSKLPFPVLASDVRDVVYATWIVPLDAVTDLVPPNVSLLTRNGKTLLTVLTYRHGHFGPALAGPFRRLFPSPLQSNWRLYLDENAEGFPHQRRVVLFIKNIFDSTFYTLGTRLFSDVLPSHSAGRFTHICDSAGSTTEIAGPGSAPAMRLATLAANKTLPSDFRQFFSSWEDAAAFMCLQDAAIADVPDISALAYSGIDLPIDLATVEPREVTDFAGGAVLTELGAVALPFCFRVPAVRFRVISEQILPR